ncbi:MAG: putative NADH:ubiquinone oxidoreductase, subunit RnfC [Firmicutes bacterium]|nr:putative NADH:ubiquinone oxidoreductase, subunit RnfC [Bacillota bacterium]
MREDVMQKIKNAGVIGAGGAGFPTHAKISTDAKMIIVNGAECEPLLRVDQQLMEEMPQQIIRGLLAMMDACGAIESIIGIKGKHKEAISRLQQAVAGQPVRIHVLEDFYPAGDEHVLVYETTGRLVPQGGIPLQVGCAVVNAETLINIAAALDGTPVTDTFLTVTGAVKQPVTFKLPIGTSVREALALAGQTDLSGVKVIEGGPMMGKIVDDLDQPITKTTKGLIVLPQEHPLIQKRTMPVSQIVRQTKSACIQCRYCTDLCPRYLLGHNIEPHKIMRSIKHIQSQEKIMKMAMVCSECGLCEQYACLMRLSPRTINAMLKQELLKQGLRPDALQKPQEASKLREQRRVPVKRLIARLGLNAYDRKAPLTMAENTVRMVEIKLKQHVGAPGSPVVKVGDQVRKGDVIAVIPEKALGAQLHASISGTVTGISDRITITAMEGSGRS